MYQQVLLVGNLGSDPELRYTKGGKAVCNFTMAVNRRWNQGDERKEETTWFRVTVWESQAEVINEYLSKGKQVLVQGRLNSDPKTGGPKIWTSQDGEARASFEVTADIVRFLQGGTASTAGDSQHNASVSASAEKDEVPF